MEVNEVEVYATSSIPTIDEAFSKPLLPLILSLMWEDIWQLFETVTNTLPLILAVLGRYFTPCPYVWKLFGKLITKSLLDLWSAETKELAAKIVNSKGCEAISSAERERSAQAMTEFFSLLSKINAIFCHKVKDQTEFCRSKYVFLV